MRGEGGVKPKAYAHYKIEHFSYYGSVQGGGGGLKTGKFERTYFLDGPLQKKVYLYKRIRTTELI